MNDQTQTLARTESNSGVLADAATLAYPPAGTRFLDRIPAALHSQAPETRRLRLKAVGIAHEEAAVGAVAKRTFDLVVSALAIVALSPVFLILAAGTKLSSAGPVFYRGVRVGQFGRLFHIIKFRTMVVGADQMGGAITTRDDPRLTRFGAYLRRFKLDELPQLFNVLIGDMSFVGPRPETPKFVALYTPEEEAILTVPQGITDWATFWNSDEDALLEGRKEDPETVYLKEIRPEKLRLQLEYVRSQSFFMDIKILTATLRVVVLRLLGMKIPAAAELQKSTQGES